MQGGEAARKTAASLLIVTHYLWTQLPSSQSQPQQELGLLQRQPKLAEVGTEGRRKGCCIPSTKHTLFHGVLTTLQMALIPHFNEKTEFFKRKLLHLPTLQFLSLTESVPIILSPPFTKPSEADLSTWLQQLALCILPGILSLPVLSSLSCESFSLA